MPNPDIARKIEPPKAPEKGRAAPAKPYLDTLIRSCIIAQNPAYDKIMQDLPLRQLIYYSTARRLAATLEHVMLNSLHYARKFVENPGRAVMDSAISDLRRTALLCLGENSMKNAGLIEMNIDKVLTSLPFTWPEELAAEPESFLSISHNDVEGVISQISSGSTGLGKRIFCSSSDLEATIAFFMHGMHYIVDPSAGDRVALMMSSGGVGQGNLAELFSEAMRRIEVPCLVVSNPNDEALTLAELAEFRPSCVVAVPRQLVSTFRSTSDSACPNASELVASIKRGLKKILLSGDRISTTVRSLLTRELEADIYLHYGMVESGTGTAVECECHQGMHYREADLMIEIIAPDGMSYPRPLPSRQTVYIDPDNHDFRIFGPTPWGEVAITTLTREASPLIRYRTGDYGRIIVDKCPCGSEVYRLETRGRRDDYIHLPVIPGDHSADGRRLLHSALDRCIFRLPWVKDQQVFVHTVSEDSDVAKDIGITLLLNADAPPDEEVLEALRGPIKPLVEKLRQQGISPCVRMLRDTDEFRGLFKYGPKRLFITTPEEIDRQTYTTI